MAKLKVGRPLKSSINLIAGLDEFTHSYLQTALWSTNDDSTPSGGEPMDDKYTLDHIGPDTIKGAIDDCRLFRQRCAPLLRDAFLHPRLQDEHTADGMGGHDFWLTRNRHGAGFGDGDWIDPVDDMLRQAAQAFGEIELYVGNDGRIHRT